MITINQDATKGRLLTRFVAADAELRVRSGIVGFQKDFGSGHQAIMSATRFRGCKPYKMENDMVSWGRGKEGFGGGALKIRVWGEGCRGPKCIFNIVIAATAIICSPRQSFKDLATPLRRAPFTSHEAKLDEQLFESMISSVRMWNADAAADEQLAAREATVAASDCCRPLFKNLEFVNRDVAHSSRRLGSHLASHHASHACSISAHEPDHNPTSLNHALLCILPLCSVCSLLALYAGYVNARGLPMTI